MRKCKICKQPIYAEISFSSLFKNDYIVHSNCVNSLLFNNDKEAFPFMNKLVYYDYLFWQVNPTYNLQYLEIKYGGILLKRNLINKDWSIIIYYEDNLFNRFKESDYQILFSLSPLPILIISLSAKKMANIFMEER